MYWKRPGGVMTGKREEEQKREFFTFFHLERTSEPVPTDRGGEWHCFRPSSPKFRSLVELAVLTEAGGRIVRSRLGLARAFIDDRADDVFARDIAKSFLRWAAPKPVPEHVAALIENIAEFSASRATIIMREPQHERPPADNTGA